MHSLPKLSVVIASFNSLNILEQCLTALVQQITEVVEVLVIRAWSERLDDYQALQQQFTQIKWINAASQATVPKMRLLGITHSQGEIVALLEDDCVVSSNWCANVIKAHQADPIAIGGAVEPGAYKNRLDWGVYFCEYARFMQPFEGVVKALPGNNVSYKRVALNQFLQEQGEEGFYETFIHWSLQNADYALIADPVLSVHNVNSWQLSNLLSVPYHHGRGFAGMRLAGLALARRLAFLGVSVLLPLVLTGRVIKQVIRRRRYISQLFGALPAIFLFSLSWSVGEFTGYLVGSGRSLGYWR